MSEQSISENKRLDIIVVSLNTFVHRADKDEIWVNGSLYDIGKYEIAGDSVHVTVYHDKDEEGWIENIASIFEASETHLYDCNSHHITKARSVNSNDNKILPEQSRCADIIPHSLSNNLTDQFFFCFPQVYSRVNIPPPKTVFSPDTA